MLAVVTERLAAPESRDNVEAFVEQPCAAFQIHRLADLVETAVALSRAQPDRKNDPPARQMIERRHFARQLPRPAPRWRSQQRADLHTLGAHGYRRERHPRVEP